MLWDYLLCYYWMTLYSVCSAINVWPCTYSPGDLPPLCTSRVKFSSTLDLCTWSCQMSPLSVHGYVELWSSSLWKFGTLLICSWCAGECEQTSADQVACRAAGCLYTLSVLFRSRELHDNVDNSITALIRGNTAVTGTTLYIFPR